MPLIAREFNSDDWNKVSVSSIAARDGFTVEMEWANHRVTELVTNSRIGDNCRIRVNQHLVNNILKNASSENSNPLYRIIDLQNRSFVKVGRIFQ